MDSIYLISTCCTQHSTKFSWDWTLSNLGYIYHCLLAIRIIESCESLIKLIYFPFNFCIHSFTTSSITHSIFSSAYMHWNCIRMRLFLVVLINLVSTCVMGVWWSVLFTPLDLWPHSEDLTWKDFRTGLLAPWTSLSGTEWIRSGWSTIKVQFVDALHQN